MATLEASIQDFYAAFSDVPAPKQIDGCPCCIDAKKIPVLLKTPRQQLTPDDLSCYSASTFNTVGDVADYLYFLPRILEITTQDGGWWPSLEVTARAIRETRFDSWPTRRREALKTLLNAALRSSVERGVPSNRRMAVRDRPNRVGCATVSSDRGIRHRRGTLVLRGQRGHSAERQAEQRLLGVAKRGARCHRGVVQIGAHQPDSLPGLRLHVVID
jgi:ribosomal protein S13